MTSESEFSRERKSDSSSSSSESDSDCDSDDVDDPLVELQKEIEKQGFCFDNAERIGHGGYGKVIKIEDKAGAAYAAKITEEKKKNRESQRMERELWAKLKHDYVVPLSGSATMNNYMALIMPLAICDLVSLLRN